MADQEQDKKKVKPRSPGSGKVRGIQGPVKQPGMLEKLVQRVGEGLSTSNPMKMVPGDRPYLRQFMNPSVDMLPTQDRRPRYANIPRGMPVRQSPLPDEFVATIVRNKNLLGGLDTWDYVDKLFGHSPLSYGHSSLDGLGDHIRSVGKDNEGEFLSLFDKWDFDSPAFNSILGTLMDRVVGSPFAVYDQFQVLGPVDPKTSSKVVKVKRRKPTGKQ